jgi:ABC-type nitrate/sulfonate/bicarbonate transport system substrate-binding protein
MPAQSSGNSEGSAASLGTIRFFDLSNVDVRDVPLLMAMDALREQGYTVEVTYMNSSNLIADALARGDAEIGLLNHQTMWAAIEKGADVRTIAQPTGHTAVVIADQSIRTCADLAGKRVGFANLSGTNPTLFKLYIDTNCPGTQYDALTIAEADGRLAAMLAGELDATSVPSEQGLALERQAPGRFHKLFAHSEEFPNVLVDGLHVNRAWAEANPQAVRDFLRAMLVTYRQVLDDPQMLYAEAAAAMSLSAEDAEIIGNLHLDGHMWDANGVLTPENIRYTLDFLIEQGALPTGLTYEDVADLSYLDDVLAEIGRR